MVAFRVQPSTGTACCLNPGPKFAADAAVARKLARITRLNITTLLSGLLDAARITSLAGRLRQRARCRGQVTAFSSRFGFVEHGEADTPGTVRLTLKNTDHFDP